MSGEIRTGRLIPRPIAPEDVSPYATEAPAAVRDHGLSALGLWRMIALIHPDNDGSKRVGRRLGFASERLVPFQGRTVEQHAPEA